MRRLSSNLAVTWAREHLSALGLFSVLILAHFFRFDFIFAERVISDEGLYLWYASRILQDPVFIFSKEISFHHPPLFPAILAAARVLIGDDIAFRLVPYFFYMGGIVAIFSLSKRVGGNVLGLICAFLLAFHPAYFNTSTFMIIDVPLAVTGILYILALDDVLKEGSLGKQVAAGILAAAVILFKSYGIIILLVTLGVLIIQRKKLPVFLAILFGAGILGIANRLNIEEVIFRTSLISRGGLLLLWTNLGELVKHLSMEGLLIFALIGTGKVRRCSETWKTLLILLFGVFFVFVMLTGIRFEYRFLLLILPYIIIVAGFGVQRIYEACLASLRGKKHIAVFAAALFCTLTLSSFSRVYPSLLKDKNNFTGYAEAGEAVKAIAGQDALIFAGSERQIRYFSGINYSEYGGNIIALRQPRDEFEKMVRDHDGQVIVEVDRWESIQPAWLAMLPDEELRRYMESAGFDLVHAVVRDKPVDSAERILYHSQPVIFLFEKPAVKKIFDK